MDSTSPQARTLNRREALGAGAAGAAGLALAGYPNVGAARRRGRRPIARDGTFPWGVASGFPGTREIVLWTRVGELERSSRLTVEVAGDRNFRNVVKRRRVVSFRRRDWTVHALIKGLRPDREYFYRFHTRQSSSPIGRFVTAPPPGSMRPVRIGFFSCQNWQAGYYNAHNPTSGLAAERDLDLVVCLGDYIYEDRTYSGPRSDNTGRNNDGDAQFLNEYRQKYRLYQSDPDLQAVHAAFPFVSIWDDHEVEDNYAADGPGAAAEEGMTNYGAPRRRPFPRRRDAAYHAFFEAMPRKRRSKQADRIFGRQAIGGMADLLLLDQRQYRDPQPCGDAFAQPCPEAEEPGRTMLGGRQKRWLKRELTSSQARWRVLGNQLMLMSFDIAPKQPVVVDSWDGYVAERREILEHVLAKDVDNLVALTGDIHTFFAGQTTTTGRTDGTPAGVEFVGGSVTSLGVKETLGDVDGIENLEAVLPISSPHIDYADFDRRGYGVIELTADQATVEFKGPKTALEPGSPVDTFARFRVASGSHDVQQIS